MGRALCLLGHLAPVLRTAVMRGEAELSPRRWGPAWLLCAPSVLTRLSQGLWPFISFVEPRSCSFFVGGPRQFSVLFPDVLLVT